MKKFIEQKSHKKLKGAWILGVVFLLIVIVYSAIFVIPPLIINPVPVCGSIAKSRNNNDLKHISYIILLAGIA